jgi:energy-coupling factor transporter ATP-binding protein EcfA2
MLASKNGVYLTRLSLTDIKSFKGQRVLELCDVERRLARWTLILGDNGVGKTTLLQCVGHLAPFRNTKAKDGDENPIFFIEPFGGSDVKTIEQLARHGSHHVRLEAEFVAAGMLGELVRKQSKSFVNWIDLTRRANKTLTFKTSKSPDRIDADPLIIGYGAGRRMGRKNLDSIAAAASLSSLFDDHAELVDAEELLQQLDYAYLRNNKRGAAARQYTVMKQMLASLLPDIGDPNNIVIHGPSPVTRSGKVGVHAITPYGEISFSDLSFGYQTMAAWLADIAYRLLRHYPDSNNPLLMPAIVLVDEIDLHLHPKWQRQLRDRLARHFPAVQFIATAHSPLMAQAYMSENLAVVRRDGDHVDIENEPRTVAGWRLNEVITSDLFGLETPFSPDVEQLLDEQRELGAVSKRSPKQDARLKELDERLRNLPQESDERDSRAMDIIRRAAARLEEMDGNT